MEKHTCLFSNISFFSVQEPDKAQIQHFFKIKNIQKMRNALLMSFVPKSPFPKKCPLSGFCTEPLNCIGYFNLLDMIIHNIGNIGNSIQIANKLRHQKFIQDSYRLFRPQI